jgi:uncharacterized protein YutD
MEKISAYNMRIGSLVKEVWNEYELQYLYIVYEVSEIVLAERTYHSFRLKGLYHDDNVTITFSNDKDIFGNYFVISY